MAPSNYKTSRREFLQQSGTAVASTILAGGLAAESTRAAAVEPLLRLQPTLLQGSIQRDSAAAPIEGAVWYEATAAGTGLRYTFEPGAVGRSSVAHG